MLGNKDVPISDQEPVSPTASTPGRAPWVLSSLVGFALLAVVLTSFNSIVNDMGFVLEAVFLLYFARHLAFAIAALRTAPTDLSAPVLPQLQLPRVSVLVACKNEESVVDGLVDHLLALDYPSDLVEMVLIDDGSSDDTGILLDRRCAQDSRLRCLHRAIGSRGGKSSALNAGFLLTTGEIVVVFDSDHEPHSDVLIRLTRHFADPRVDAVQGRCRIRNAGDSMIAELVAIDYLAGYLVNQYGRQALYELPAYGGANCAVRASSLRSLGGWNPATVTEDTDLTMRLMLNGSQIRYDSTSIDEEEAVLTLSRYWHQRYRWARGHQQVWRDYRMAMWRSSHLSFAQKIETTMFLLAFHVPVVSLFGFGVLGLWLTGVAHPQSSVDMSILWTLLFLGPMLELGAGLLIAKVDRKMVWQIPLALPLMMVGMFVCGKAWIDGVLGRPYSWVKTMRAADAL